MPRGPEPSLDVRGRFFAAAATGKVPEALAREFVEAQAPPAHGPWRFRIYWEQLFDYDQVTGIALIADHDKTGEHRRYAVSFPTYRAARRPLVCQLLQVWLLDLNRDGARGWPRPTPRASWALRLV